MSWEWSHSNEALEKGYKNLEKKSMTFLAECYGEWACDDIVEAERMFSNALDEVCRYDDHLPGIPGELTTNPLCDGRYEKFKKDAMKMEKGDLVTYIWQRASNQRTCDNGGQHAWVCPHGCHTVKW